MVEKPQDEQIAELTAERDQARAEVERLTRERDEARQQRDEIPATLVTQRIGADSTPCRRCGGSGVRTYGNSATWRGGAGGQAITADVCDKCWGSGNAEKPWPSWRKFEIVTTERDAALKRAEEAEAKLAATKDLVGSVINRKLSERIVELEQERDFARSAKNAAMQERVEILQSLAHDVNAESRATAAEAENARLRGALRGLESCISYSDTMGCWVLAGNEMTRPALASARAALAGGEGERKDDATLCARCIHDDACRANGRAINVPCAEFFPSLKTGGEG